MQSYALYGLGIDGCYGRYRLENGDALRDKFFELGLDGANVTVPHKESAFRACDEVDEFAKRVGAVNTVVRRGDRLYGYNTDAMGFLRVVESFGAVKIFYF